LSGKVDTLLNALKRSASMERMVVTIVIIALF